jgi:hypothetical protein
MENPPRTGNEFQPKSSLEQFEFQIGILALVLYVLERCAAFAFLQSRIAVAGAIESRIMEFFFGRAPYSVFDIVLGFGPPENMLEILNPINILKAGLQAGHFLVNWLIVGLPFRVYLKFTNFKKEQ